MLISNLVQKEKGKKLLRTRKKIEEVSYIQIQMSSSTFLIDHSEEAKGKQRRRGVVCWQEGNKDNNGKRSSNMRRGL
jgi:hypothetical protein